MLIDESDFSFCNLRISKIDGAPHGNHAEMYKSDFMLQPCNHVNFREIEKRYEVAKLNNEWVPGSWDQDDAKNAASDPLRHEELVIYACRYYNEVEWYDGWFAPYQELVNITIKTNNIQGLNILWLSIEWHDRDNPRYELDFLTATEFSDFNMFLHVMWYRSNGCTHNGMEDTSYNLMLETAKKNPDKRVYRLLSSLSEFVNSHPTNGMPGDGLGNFGFEPDIGDDLDEDDQEFIDCINTYYETVKYFVDKLRSCEI